MGAINDSVQDTSPGSGSLLAPPEGFSGNASRYSAWFNRRMKECPGFRQRVGLMARWAPGEIEYNGTYAEAAKKAVGRIRKTMVDAKATQKKGGKKR